jgi:enoyl-CoA hydratase/carnithine racemase
MLKRLETVEVEFNSDRGVGYITLSRPESLNSMNIQMSTDISTALELLEEKDNESDGVAVRVVVIEGAEDKAFCAGADINGFGDNDERTSGRRNHRDYIRVFPAPVVAKIQGYCLGGGFETALACDFRLAHEDSEFGLPEADLGLIPGAGGVQYVSRYANPELAKELAMTAEFISAHRAAQEGLVSKVFDRGEFAEGVTEFVNTIASKAPLALRAIKRSANLTTQAGLEEGIDFDQQQFELLLETDDFQEGTKTFSEDREPKFTGR